MVAGTFVVAGETAKAQTVSAGWSMLCSIVAYQASIKFLVGLHPIVASWFYSHVHGMKPNQFSLSENPRTASAADTVQNEINFTPSTDQAARKACFAYENQGSQPGHEVQHWLKAEADLIAERNLTRVHGFLNQA